MSIGNLKDSGNQGNNFPWQLKMLQGLQCICDEVKEINIDTDDLEQLLADLIAELAAGIDVNVTNGTGAAAVNIQDGGNSITVDGTVSIAAAQFTKVVTPRALVLSPSSNPTGSIGNLTYSVSFASNGTSPALISTDSGVTYQSIPAGTTINFDAGGLGWYYEADVFYWDVTASGASLIITYNK